jgi:asparagine synthase (glutamine-hydrolysing)
MGPRSLDHGASATDAPPLQFQGGSVSHARSVEAHRDDGMFALALGSPYFADPDDQAHAREFGHAAAWLNAFGRVGTDAFACARGRFAVAVLKPREHKAWLACDRFATWPLCYATHGGEFAFADRADAVPTTSRRVSQQALFEYLYFHMIPAPRTIFEGVHRVRAGHFVAWDGGVACQQAWWIPQFHEPRSAPLDALKEEFRTLVRKAVARDAAGATVGAFLSGGTDSSTIVGMLRQVAGAPVKAYSIGFEAGGYDEMAYARIAARHFGAEHHEHYVTPAELLDHIPHVATYYDQPFGNSSAVPASICAHDARGDGVTRLLAGDGGDELFGGNSRYAKQRVFEWYTSVPLPLRRGVIEPAIGSPALQRMPLVPKATSYVEQARVPLPDRLQMYNLLLRLGTRTIFTNDFVDTVDVHQPLVDQRATWQSVHAESYINRMLAFDWRYTLADNDLPKVIGAATLAGIDVRFPLLAEELVDFSLRLPPEWKLKGLKLRWFFKESLKGFLPPEIIAKRKHGFGLPFGVWAVEQPALAGMAADALHAFAERGVIRRDFLYELMRHWLPKHPGYYGELVWVVMMLELWLQAYEPDWRLP